MHVFGLYGTKYCLSTAVLRFFFAIFMTHFSDNDRGWYCMTISFCWLSWRESLSVFKLITKKRWKISCRKFCELVAGIHYLWFLLIVFALGHGINGVLRFSPICYIPFREVHAINVDRRLLIQRQFVVMKVVGVWEDSFVGHVFEIAMEKMWSRHF